MAVSSRRFPLDVFRTATRQQFIFRSGSRFLDHLLKVGIVCSSHLLKGIARRSLVVLLLHLCGGVMTSLVRHLQVVAPLSGLTCSFLEFHITFPFLFFLLRSVTSYMLLSQFAVNVVRCLVQRGTTPPSLWTLSLLTLVHGGGVFVSFSSVCSQAPWLSCPLPVAWTLNPLGLARVSLFASIVRVRITLPIFRRVVISHRSSFSPCESSPSSIHTGRPPSLRDIFCLYCRGILELGISVVFTLSRALLVLSTSCRSARVWLGLILTHHVTRGEATCLFCYGRIQDCAGVPDLCPPIICLLWELRWSLAVRR